MFLAIFFFFWTKPSFPFTQYSNLLHFLPQSQSHQGSNFCGERTRQQSGLTYFLIASSRLFYGSLASSLQSQPTLHAQGTHWLRRSTSDTSQWPPAHSNCFQVAPSRTLFSYMPTNYPLARSSVPKCGPPALHWTLPGGKLGIKERTKERNLLKWPEEFLIQLLIYSRHCLGYRLSCALIKTITITTTKKNPKIKTKQKQKQNLLYQLKPNMAFSF